MFIFLMHQLKTNSLVIENTVADPGHGEFVAHSILRIPNFISERFINLRWRNGGGVHSSPNNNQ